MEKLGRVAQILLASVSVPAAVLLVVSSPAAPALRVAQIAVALLLLAASGFVVARIVRTLIRDRDRTDYAGVLDYVADAVWVERVDPRRIAYVNRAFERVFGLQREVCYEDPDAWLKLLTETQGKVGLDLWRSAGEINPERRELEIVRPDGTRRWIRTDQIPLRMDGARVIEAVCVASDVTELHSAIASMKQNRAQLIQAEKLASLGILVAGIAHEINNPDHTIMATAAILEEAWKDLGPILDEYVEENGDFTVAGTGYDDFRESMPLYLDGLLRASERIRDIVAHLRDFARQDVYDVSAEVDVNEVVQSAVALTGSFIQKHTSRFDVLPASDLPKVHGNAQRLQQVILNLIHNACQALTSSQEAVSVATRYLPLSDQVAIIVEDEGAGISPEDLLRVFDPFYTTRRTSGGMGLGLSVSKSIVDEHGGALEIAPAETRGTKATVLLPAARIR